MSAEVRRGIEHLKAAEGALKRARAEAVKVDAAPEDGMRLVQWGHVFGEIASASLEIDKLKVLAALEVEASLERNREHMTWRERLSVTSDLRRIRRTIGKR